VAESLPPGTQSTVIVSGAEAWLFDSTLQPSLTLAPGSDDVTVLYYAATAAELSLTADETGRLIRATAPFDPEDTWRLPPTASGAKLSARDDAFEAVTDAAELAARVDAIRIPAPGCGDLAVLDSFGLPVLPAGFSIDAVASIGDAALMTFVDGGQRPRALFVRGHDVTELSLSRPLGPDARLVSLAGDQAFWLVTTSTSRLTVHQVDLAGAPSLVRDEPSPTVKLALYGAWPGTDALIGLDGAQYKIMQLDLRAGPWRTIATLATPSSPMACPKRDTSQAFALTSSTSGVAAFSLLRPFYFTPQGAGRPVTGELDLGVPCLSAYLRLAGGAEVLQQASDADFLANFREISAWRVGDGAWRTDETMRRLNYAVSIDGDTIGIDTQEDIPVMMSFDPRRPDMRPRICARAPFGRVLRVSFDGALGFAVQKPSDALPYAVVRFERRR